MTQNERTAGIAQLLRNAADDIEAIASREVDAPTATSLREAWAALDPILDDISIEVELRRYGHGGRAHLSIRVWDGKKFFEGKTLQDSVAQCLAAHAPQPEPKEMLDAIAEIFDPELAEVA